MFATAPMAALFSAVITVALAVLIVPLFDLTPLLALVVVASTGPWRGVARAWLNTAAAVAGVMVVEWVFAYTLFALSGGSVSTFFGARMVGILTWVWWIYPAQLVLLLLVFGFAAAVSLFGIRRVGAQVAISPGTSGGAAAADGQQRHQPDRRTVD
jgi:hypothetical protein